MISGFIQGLRPPALNGLGKLAQRRWRQAREVAAYAEFTPGEVGPGAVSPALPASDLAPENVRAAVLADAAEILRGKFSVFRGQVLSVHTPPIWDRDYLAGQEAPATARSAQLEITKLPGNMDVRVVWELNRWTQLVRLAQAFHLSRDEHFRRTIIEWLENWEQQNPVGCGWNWTRVTEAALRLINLTWIDALCGLPEALLSKLLPPHVWWVHRYHEVGFAEEEDSLAAVSALICVIARWPQAELWSEAMESLQVKFAAEIEEQFAADGVHRSQSLHYHLLACELCWQAQRAGSLRRQTLPPTTLARLAAAGLALASLRSVNESWPCGASDDSHLTPCYESDLTSAAEWQAWCGGATNAISYWLGPAPAVAADRPLTHWGIFCKDEWQLLWHLNALGTSAHSHQDVLHCSISHGGLAVMIDPGTGRSFPASALRDRLAGPTAHNGPHLLDLACYPQRLGNFGWSKGGSQPHRHGNSAAVRIRGHTLTRSISELERGWRFTDECTAPFAVHWQLAPGWEVEPHDDYLLLFRDGHSLRLQITGPACRIVNETCSPGYGQVIDAPMIMALAAAGGCVVTELTAERLL